MRNQRSIKRLLLSSWAILGGFVLSAFASGAYSHEIAYGKRPSGTLGICGNSVSEPICLVLSYGVPLLFGVTLNLGIQSARHVVPWPHSAGLFVISTACVAAYVTYAASFFRPLFGDAPVLESIWWIAPFQWIL